MIQRIDVEEYHHVVPSGNGNRDEVTEIYLFSGSFMPLDSHSYLVSQGWAGKGTGLRQGAISRPLAIPQKKTLAGLGKDRDEAFPFWDQ